MRSIGCGCVCLLITVLSACSSNQSSLESQIKEDLKNVVNLVSQNKNLSKKLPKTPPSSGMLNEDYIAMYVWVKARSMQLRIARINGLEKQALSTEEQPLSKTDSHKQRIETSVTVDHEQLEFELSIDEVATLEELNFGPELYSWVRQTIDNTMAFVESTGESDIVDLVTFYDPVIKHNIALVKDFKEKLQFADSVQLRINTTYQNLKVSKRPAVLEKANLVVWSG